MEGQIPGCTPGILLFVGHRDNVDVVEAAPVMVASLKASSGRFWLCRNSLQPLRNIVVVELLGPDQAASAWCITIPAPVGSAAGVMSR
ncbi:hypothetical protein [Leptolyngbya sp. FACHB-261]|uniref:hypothetical protein n=1 Tax=Leptolyngbya sp. FACHB-261 TaxID=2692806 RepID=UPI00168319D4|nr:hypothetical protein [Leptolyngbya sp. FACHB-261]